MTRLNSVQVFSRLTRSFNERLLNTIGSTSSAGSAVIEIDEVSGPMWTGSLTDLLWGRVFVNDLLSNGNGFINKPLFSCRFQSCNAQMNFNLSGTVSDYHSVGFIC